VKEARQQVGSQVKEVIVIGEAIGATPLRDLIHNDGEVRKEKKINRERTERKRGVEEKVRYSD
jgi:hypothetical protein